MIRPTHALKERIAKELLARGIRINIDACGCCDSPWVSLEIDGELICEDVQNMDLCMIDDRGQKS